MIRFAALLFAITVSFLSFGQVAEKDAIGAAIRAGDAKALSTYMMPNVDLTVNDVEDVYSKNQAEVILNQFFVKQKPTGFEVKHEGKSKMEDFYYIGDLTTASAAYRLTFFLKKEGNSFRIKQLRIEPE
jgi:hypothetical protein